MFNVRYFMGGDFELPKIHIVSSSTIGIEVSLCKKFM